MRQAFAAAGQAAWSHILPAGTLATPTPPERWHPGNGGEVLVVEADGALVGFACGRGSQDADASSTIGEIDAFYTHPSVWGCGAGRALISAAITRLAELGFTEATLWTEHRNHRPRRFYERAGWTLDGAERRRDFRGIELLELRYRITV